LFVQGNRRFRFKESTILGFQKKSERIAECKKVRILVIYVNDKHTIKRGYPRPFSSLGGFGNKAGVIVTYVLMSKGLYPLFNSGWRPHL